MVSGGTDVLVELQRGVKPTQTLIDITALESLKYVRREGDEIVIGGLATHNDVLASQDCRSRALSLVQACAEVGAPQIRTRGTLAGNIVTASPANDTIAPLVALGSKVVLRSERGDRTVDIEAFFTGFRTTVMAPDELVAQIRVRATQPDERSTFLKLGLRRAQAISVIALAAGVALEKDGRVQCARIAIGCVAPTIVRVPKAEAFLAGKKLISFTTSAMSEPWLNEQGQWLSLRYLFDHYLTHAFGMQADEHVHFGNVTTGMPKLWADRHLYAVEQQAKAVCATVLTNRAGAAARVAAS